MVLYSGKIRRQKNRLKARRNGIALLLAAMMFCSTLPNIAFALGNEPSVEPSVPIAEATPAAVPDSSVAPVSPSVSPSPSDSPTAYPSEGYVNANGVNVRTGADTASAVVAQLTENTPVRITGEENGWYLITAGGIKAGYIRMDYVTLGEPPSGHSSETIPLCTCTDKCGGEHINADCPACAIDASACTGTQKTTNQIDATLPLYELLEAELSQNADDGGTVNVTGLLPKDARLSVTAVSEAQIVEYISSGARLLFAYDIKIMIPGETEGSETEYQPSVPLCVSVTPPTENAVGETVAVTHVDAGNHAETLEASVADGAVAFSAEGFSLYIGTIPPTLINVDTLYYNGTNFYTDEACTAGNAITDISGTAITTLPELLPLIAGDLTVYMKNGYTVSGTETLDGGTVYSVTLKRYDDTSAANGDYLGALVTVPSGASLTLSNITVDGGAVWASDTLTENTVNSGTLSSAALLKVLGTAAIESGAVLQNNDNSTADSSETAGGGVYVGSSAALTINAGAISRNRIANCGGGIIVRGTLQIRGGEISGNAAADTATDDPGGRGGGVYILSGTVTMSGGVIRGNYARMYGGGLRADRVFRMEDGEISGNSAQNGGGVYVNGHNGSMTLNGGRISGNISTSTGGGIYVGQGAASTGAGTKGPTLTMTGGVVSGNSGSTGGGLFLAGWVDFIAAGGSIFGNSGVAPDVYCGNYTGNGGPGGTPASGETRITGGTFNMEKHASAPEPTNGSEALTLHTVTLVDGASGTTPVETNAVVTGVTQTASYDYGTNGVKTDSSGKLYLWLPAAASASRVTTDTKSFAGTSASGTDTTFYSSSAYLFVNGSLTTGNNDGSSPANAYHNFADALTSATSGVSTIVVCGSTPISAQQTVTKDIVITSVNGGTDYRTAANGSAKLIRSANTDGNGTAYTGTLQNVTGTLTLQNVTVDGGAVWDTPTVPSSRVNSGIKAMATTLAVQAGGTLNLLDGAVLQNNDTTGAADICHGGAIYCLGAVNMRGGAILYNTAKSYGGAVNMGTGNVAFDMSGGAIEYNHAAAGWGGAFYVSSGGLNISGGSTSNNSASQAGGAVYQSAGTVNMNGGSMAGNVAYYGGAVVVYSYGKDAGTGSSSTFNMTGGSITGNRAVIGGGLCLHFNSYTGSIVTNISGGSITGNTANSGSAIGFYHTEKTQTPDSTLNITGGTLSGAAADGSSIYVDKGHIVLASAIDIKDNIKLDENMKIEVAEAGFTTNAPLCVELAAAADGATAVDYALADITAASAEELAKFKLVQPGFTLAQDTTDLSLLVLRAQNAFYLDGQSGNDENDGSTPARAVKTLKKAYELAATGGTVYICGEVKITEDTILSGTGYSDGASSVSVTGGKVSLMRYSRPIIHDGVLDDIETTADAWQASYTGNLITVSGSSLTLSSLEINGHKSAVSGTGTASDAPAVAAESSIIYVERDAKLYIKSGAALRDNNNASGGTVDAYFVDAATGGVTWTENGSGGVITLAGRLFMSGGSITGGQAARNGGGVYALPESTFTMTGGTIQGNTAANALDASNISGFGGGVAVMGDMYMKGGTIQGNAVYNAGAKGTGAGGGAFVGMNGKLEVSGGSISGNTSAQYGGGVAAWGEIVLISGSITGNTAAFLGGGVYLRSAGNTTGSPNGGLLIMSGGSISKNTSNSNGGGVYDGNQMIMSGGEISGNTSAKGGGISSVGTFIMRGGKISGNTGTDTDGGGLYNSNNGAFTMTGGSISGNTAKNGGGGVINYSVASVVTITDGDISGNTAQNGGGIYNSGKLYANGGSITGNEATISGGGIFATNTTMIDGSVLSQNTAADNGGGIYGRNTTVASGEISGNTATRGGGIYQAGGATALLTVQGGTVSGNTAAYGGGVFTASSTDTFTMTGGTILGNTAGTRGGGVYSSGRFTLSGGEISGNIASTDGGGVYKAGSGTLELSGSGEIIDNTAALLGGGVYVANGSFTMTDGHISRNTATGDNGGGVFVLVGTFTLQNGTISGNTTGKSGGGVFASNEAALFTMEGGTITGNSAAINGGGVGVNAGHIRMSGGSVYANTADSDGNGTGAGHGIGIYGNAGEKNALVLSGAPMITDEVYLAITTRRIAVVDGATPFAPVSPIPVKTAVTTAGTVVASYYSSYTDATTNTPRNTEAADLADFTMTDPALSLALGTDDPATLIIAAGGGVRYIVSSGTGDGLTPDSPCSVTRAYQELANGGGTMYVVALITFSGSQSISGTSYYTGANTYNITNGSVNIKRYSQPTNITGLTGYTRASYTGALFNVTGTLTLSDITIDGHRYKSTSTDARYACPAVTAQSAMITVQSGGTLNINGGTELRNNYNTVATGAGAGGAVYVLAGGEGRMNGGTVTGCRAYVGGGVNVRGKFTMEDGTVVNNTSPYNCAGIYIFSTGSFTMTGGTITGNVADGCSGGLGVDGTAVITGGEIYGNTAQGTNTVSSPHGSAGGIGLSTGKLTISGGSVHSNTSLHGSAIAAYGGTPTLPAEITVTGGEISGRAEDGTCVAINQASLTLGANGPASAFTIKDPVYLAAGTHIDVKGELNADAIPVAGAGFAPGRVIAAYASGLTPDDTQFAVSSAYGTRVSGQNVALWAGGTVTASGEGVILGAGQSDSFTLPLSELFTAGTQLRIANVTLTEQSAGNGFTHEAYNTVYQNRRNYGYTASNKTFGLSVAKTGGGETDTVGTNIALGTMAAGDTLTFRVYGANAITEEGVAGTLTVTLTDGTNSYPIEISVNRKSGGQINVTVPVQVTASLDAQTGAFTFPGTAGYYIENYSTVPVQIKSMAWAWDTTSTPLNASTLFADHTRLTAQVRLGGVSGASYSFTGETPAAATTDADPYGRIIAYNGVIPGRLTLAWGMTLGDGNSIAKYSSGKIKLGSVTYTIGAAGN